MRRHAVLALAALLLLDPEVATATGRRAARRTSTHTAAVARERAARPAPRAERLAQAKANLAALLRDRTRRRYRHHWERAITGLVQAAKGKDRGPALLEAAKARYALYRWSADEADREQALKLAAQAQRAGAADAKGLALAIRREAGDDERPPAPRRAGKPAPPAETTATAEAEDAPEPALDRVMAALSEGTPAPAAGADAPTSTPEAADAAQGPAQVSEVRAWSSPEYTRVAVYLSHWVPWQQLELPADAGLPRRLAVDLKPAELKGPTFVRPLVGGQVARVRAAQKELDKVRVVLDLAGKDGVKVFRMDDPPRLVLDVGTPVKEAAPVVAAAPTAAVPAPTDAAAPAAASPGAPSGDGQDTRVELPARALAALEGQPKAVAPTPPAAADGDGGEAADEDTEVIPDADLGGRTIRRVVVDAGHGGHDPGAIGPTRVREKDVTLAIARKLARKLRAAGFQVVLTRDDDRFVALEERTAIANAAKADLFVSVHANANPRRSRTGVESYFLNVTDDRYAARLAARENGVDLSTAGDVARILTDLDAKASAGASVTLARLVQREVCGGIRARVGDVRDLGVKSALFYVLLGARMPAVLVETGFISNRGEEKRLSGAAYQDEVATGIARAVEGFARAPAARIASVQ